MASRNQDTKQLLIKYIKELNQPKDPREIVKERLDAVELSLEKRMAERARYIEEHPYSPLGKRKKIKSRTKRKIRGAIDKYGQDAYNEARIYDSKLGVRNLLWIISSYNL